MAGGGLRVKMKILDLLCLRRRDKTSAVLSAAQGDNERHWAQQRNANKSRVKRRGGEGG